MSKKIDEYLSQDINNPKYLFHGSPKKLEKLIPIQSHDSNYSNPNVAKAVFLFPSFLKSTPYAFKDTIKEKSQDLPYNFNIPNDNTYPIMTMENVNVEEDIVGYIYVFLKDEDMIKDEGTYQYKCYKELIPYDVVEIHYDDYKDYYEINNHYKKSV